MHHVQNKTLPTPLLNFSGNVKNGLNLNTRSRMQEKLNSLFLNCQELKKL